MKISWDKRHIGDVGCSALVTIDGTDMPVQHRFDPKFCSHKFLSNGLQYEVGVCIQLGNIVWINGPFRGGENDLNIARQSLIGALDEGEMVEADGGYCGEKWYIKVPKDATSEEQKRLKTITRSCHETANKRFKIFEVLKKQFRHELEKHLMCFRAVAVITQLSIENGHPLFTVEYLNIAGVNDV